MLPFLFMVSYNACFSNEHLSKLTDVLNKIHVLCLPVQSHIIIVYYSHFIGHLLSRYRRISDCLYSIVYGQAGRYAP